MRATHIIRILFQSTLSVRRATYEATLHGEP